MTARTPRRPPRSRDAPPAGALVFGLAVCACANVQAPPGTLPDDVPPRVSEIAPGRDTVVPGFDGSVRVRFDEPVNFPNDLSRRLVASPLEPYVVETGFSDVRLRPRDGWRDGVVYCLELPAGLNDVLRNRTESPIGFCFSTGPPLAETRLSGTVRDAVTGQTQADARVIFLALPSDSTPYGWVTDSEGRFELRALPPGSYRALAFLDRNRNLTLDRTLEAYDSVSVRLGPTGSVDLEFALVEPDSTAPRLVRAEALDSVTVRLEFDDPLRRPQPGAPRVAVRDTLTGREMPVLAFRIGEPSQVDLPLPPAPPDTADVAAPPDTADLAEPPAGAEAAPPPVADTVQGPVAPDTAPPRPSPVVSIRLGAALPAGVYRVSAEGFANLRDLVGGGDTTFVHGPAGRGEEAGEPDPSEDDPPPPGEDPPSGDPPPTNERADRPRRARGGPPRRSRR